MLLVGSLVIIARSPDATELAPLLVTERLSITLLGILLFFRWRVVASVGGWVEGQVCRVCCMSLAFFLSALSRSAHATEHTPFFAALDCMLLVFWLFVSCSRSQPHLGTWGHQGYGPVFFFNQRGGAIQIFRRQSSRHGGGLIVMIMVMNNTTNPPTPCLWKARASAQ